MDPGMNQLLQWGIQNSNSSGPEGTESTQPAPRNLLNEDALRSLMGGPSNADLMKQAMHVIRNPEAAPESKMTAFDNFEQLIENLDNANNMEPLGLWTPLIDLLSAPEADLRRMAAWCVGTAVQNNVKSQERFLALNGIPALCKLAADDSDKMVRRKAVYALSSEVRNYQPGMDEACKCLPKDITGPDHINAENMDVIDAIMAKLREKE
jgi:hsp70-interacting protein